MNKYFATQKKIHCQDTGEICIGYNEYLNSKHWALLRQQYIPKDMKCSMCHNKCDSLQLHHLTYMHIGNEKADDLLPLCENCHKLIHKVPKENIKSELYVNTKKSRRKKKRPVRKCSNCKSFIYIKIKGKEPTYEPYCRYSAKFNPKQVCEHFRPKK